MFLSTALVSDDCCAAVVSVPKNTTIPVNQSSTAGGNRNLWTIASIWARRANFPSSRMRRNATRRKRSAVDIGGLGGKRGNRLCRRLVSICPIEARSREQALVTSDEPRVDAIAIIFEFVRPIWTGGRCLDQQRRSCGRMNLSGGWSTASAISPTIAENACVRGMSWRARGSCSTRWRQSKTGCSNGDPAEYRRNGGIRADRPGIAARSSRRSS
jgi:hypothetical protein